jgi:hypothetical protein
MADFCQIRRGYRARWRDLAFFVEGAAHQWTLRVHRAEDNLPLYTGARCGIGAARAAAVEFGVFRELGPASAVIPTQLAGELNWQEYW